jgi:hypothetical protein
MQPGQARPKSGSAAWQLFAKIFRMCVKLRDHPNHDIQTQQLSTNSPFYAPIAIMSAPQMVQCFGKKKTATAVATCKVREICLRPQRSDEYENRY